jgi:hypothetical protein
MGVERRLYGQDQEYRGGTTEGQGREKGVTKEGQRRDRSIEEGGR